MRRILADRRDTVMAGATRSKDLRVVDSESRCPYIRRVAIFTNSRCRDMCRALADCIHAIVAAGTIPCDIYMIEISRKPTCCSMTVVAIITTRDMCRMLTSRNNTIVTCATGAQDLGVIDRCGRLESDSTVAVFTDIRGLHMDQALAGGGRAIVTRNTIANNAYMVEDGRQPAGRAVAVVALVAGRNMRQRFAGRLNAVMTANAAAG